MSIRVFLADDSNAMRVAIVRILTDTPKIQFIGEAASFAETLELTAQLKPDVLLLDLHMHDEYLYPPEVVRREIRKHSKHVLAISMWDDQNANVLAASLGAELLLDKTKLYAELVTTIMRCCGNEEVPMTYGEGANHSIIGERVIFAEPKTLKSKTALADGRSHLGNS
jgi:DNA-binding NarL/FixJ family response regulator